MIGYGNYINSFGKVPVAEVELVYKSKVKASQRPQIRTSGDCYEALLQSWDENKIELLEQFKIMLLNRSNRIGITLNSYLHTI